MTLRRKSRAIVPGKERIALIGGGVGVNISPTPKYASGTAIFVEGVPSGMAPSGGTLSDTPVPKPQD